MYPSWLNAITATHIDNDKTVSCGTPPHHILVRRVLEHSTGVSGLLGGGGGVTIATDHDNVAQNSLVKLPHLRGSSG